MKNPARFFEVLQRNYRDHGVRGIAETATTTTQHLSSVYQQFRHDQRATNVYDRKWDVLILLDAARHDMMAEVRGDYDFISEIGSHHSPGTASAEWMRRTFTDDYGAEMARTLHVTANTSSAEHLNSGDFLHLEEVWKDGWEKELGTIPARIVTDRAIHYHRKLQPERTIIHYMQPHPPFIEEQDIDANIVSPEGVTGDGKNFEELHEAGYTRKQLWDASIGNLEYVLDDVQLLLSNIDAERVVISSDHGQAFGEERVWGHPSSTYIDVLENVPWCVTSGSDSGEYHPEHDSERSEENPEVSLEEKLEALGYR